MLMYELVNSDFTERSLMRPDDRVISQVRKTAANSNDSTTETTSTTTNDRSHLISKHENDDDSISSLSSNDSHSHRPYRRTLFATHWAKAGASPCIITTRRCRIQSENNAGTRNQMMTFSKEEEATNDADDDDNTYEITLQQAEGVMTGRRQGRRRQIFFQRNFHSEINLSTMPLFINNSNNNPSLCCWRQSYSDSALVVVDRKKSCLRKTFKYSTSISTTATPNHDDEDSSSPKDLFRVSFSPEIMIVKYAIPQEQWANSGWSNYFH